MKIVELVKYAESQYQLTIESNVKKPIIIEAILKVDRERRNKARTLNQKSALLFASEEDPLIKVRSLRQDFPFADLKFNHDGGRGVKDKKNPDKNKNGLPYCPGFHLFPGAEYDLPLSIIRHLEKLIITDNKPQYDPATGLIAGNVPIVRNRFILQPVLTDAMMRQMGKTSLPALEGDKQ
jgi:hypothetical protein